MSTMWAFNISMLTLKFPTALQFFNKWSTSFLQQDVLAYVTLYAFYPILLFLTFSCYGFVPEVYGVPGLFPHDSLDASEIDDLSKTLIATFHYIALTEILPANAINKVYPTILQIALPGIMGDEVLSAYHFFMYDCASSDHGTQPNGFHRIKTLTPTTHPKVLTAPKVPKKKKKKQKDECNKSPEVSDNNDPSLQTKSLFDDLKRLQAAVTSAMKSELTHQLIKLLNFPVSPIYKLAIHDHIEFETNPPMLLIPHKVDNIWIERVPTDQPISDQTYHGTHYNYFPNTIISLLHIDSEWFQCLTTSMRLATLLTSPCSTTEYAFLNDVLV
uniref:Uncharacterized protein n=1 Tax=Romanomermis culicivorax TaxID=13658 RepID=A0A915IT40_ROMCU